MALDGLIINAALVDGTSIPFTDWKEFGASLTNGHVKTEAQDVILADTAASAT